jgi:hypothetical protein
MRNMEHRGMPSGTRHPHRTAPPQQAKERRVEECPLEVNSHIPATSPKA